MASKKKYEPIKLKVKKPWEIARGHEDSRGNTTFDNRPKRIRTRKAVESQWQGEFNYTACEG
jgi:hypothetical protein